MGSVGGRETSSTAFKAQKDVLITESVQGEVKYYEQAFRRRKFS